VEKVGLKLLNVQTVCRAEKSELTKVSKRRK
jgi:hypothetical protein